MTGFSLQFSDNDVEILKRQECYRGHFRVDRLSLRHRLFGGGWSETMTREVFERGDAVAVLPWDLNTDSLILVEQFRPGAIRQADSPWMLELIAGVVEPGESDPEVAHRESMEEAGCELDRLHPIATFYPSAGACSEQIRLFIGETTGAVHGAIKGLDSEYEDILVHQLPRTEALAILDRGDINNGHTLIALQWLALHGERLRADWHV